LCLNSSEKKGGKKEEEYLGIKPTRPNAAYIYFSTENVPKIKAEEKIDHKSAMGRAGEIWRGMSDSEKKKYNDMHDRDVER